MRLATLLVAASLVPAVASAQPDYDPPAEPPPPPDTNPVIVVNPGTPASVPPPVIETEPADDIEYNSVNAPVFASGALVFAGTYGASVIVAGTSDHPGANRLYVPLVGPWLALSDWGDCPISNPACDRTTGDKVMLVADGVFQAASVIAMLDGLLDPGYHRTRILRTAQHVVATPNGFAAIGTF